MGIVNFYELRQNALISRRRAIAQDFKVRGNYYSPSADKYLKELQVYGVYCKEEKQEDWLKVTRGLVNNIDLAKEYDWKYEAFLFEETAKMLMLIHGDVNWDSFVNLSSKYPATLIEDMSELLLEFSPRGVEFVENAVASKIADYDKMHRVHKMYADCVMTERKNTSKQLVKTVNEVGKNNE